MYKIMNLPNIITIFRIAILGPLAIYSLAIKNIPLYIAFLVFFFILDKLDGYIARKYNQVTIHGKILDGFADTFGLFILMAYFYIYSILSGLELFIIIFPRVFYYLAVLFIRARYKKFIQTLWWKVTLPIWLGLFVILMITGRNIGILIVFCIALYATTTWHFIKVFKRLYTKAKSNMVAK